jgi:Family of unknown function (DUF6463)
MRVWIGKSVVAIGIVHCVVGLVVYRSVILEVLGARLVNTVSLTGDPARAEAFWFLLTGIAMMIVGGMIDGVERLGQPVPPATRWGFAAVVFVGAVMMPVAGFWLGIVPVVGMIRRSRGGER